MFEGFSNPSGCCCNFEVLFPTLHKSVFLQHLALLCFGKNSEFFPYLFPEAKIREPMWDSSKAPSLFLCCCGKRKFPERLCHQTRRRANSERSLFPGITWWVLHLPCSCNKEKTRAWTAFDSKSPKNRKFH